MKYVYLRILIIIQLLVIIYLYLSHKNQSIPKENSDSPVIIWNDDPESIPRDGELIKLEFTKNDTLYIGNVQ